LNATTDLQSQGSLMPRSERHGDFKFDEYGWRATHCHAKCTGSGS